ncbi:hypothetical protein [Thalassotalea agariperforans]
MISIRAEKYATDNNLNIDDVIQQLKDGDLEGKNDNGSWFVLTSEVSKPSIAGQTKEQTGSTKNAFQDDYDLASSAQSVGRALSIVFSFIHIAAICLLFFFGSQIGFYGFISMIFPTIIIVISWAIIYALLSLVVTNAISAKHTVYQSTKINKGTSS